MTESACIMRANCVFALWLFLMCVNFAEEGVPPQDGAVAPDQRHQAIEAILGHPLPDSYKLFLQHNQVRLHFEVRNYIFSFNDIANNSKEYSESLAEYQLLEKPIFDTIGGSAADYFVIGASSVGRDIFIMEKAGARVIWINVDPIVFPGLYEMLEQRTPIIH